MAKFRKIQVEIEAVQYLGGDDRHGYRFVEPQPPWLASAFGISPEYPGAVWRDSKGLHVRAHGGVMLVEPGAWIIRGVEGEIYPCSDSVFRKTYEPCGFEHVDRGAFKPGGHSTTNRILSEIQELAKEYSLGRLVGGSLRKLAGAGALEDYVTLVAKRRCEIEARVGGEGWDSLGILARDERRRQARSAIMHALAMQELGPPGPNIGEGA